MNKKWVVTSYGHDISWLEDYTSNYIVYDKTCSLVETKKIKHQKNIGYNIFDMLNYIIENYNNLPDVCVFIKGNVFNREPEPHCNLEKFKKLIKNNTLTALESYEHIKQVDMVQKLDVDGGFMEFNNSWYLNQHPRKYFNSFNEFLFEVFENPKIENWIRFAPGCNYIVPKENLLFYSKSFFKKLKTYVDWCPYSAEAHLLERAMFTIFKNVNEEKK